MYKVFSSCIFLSALTGYGWTVAFDNGYVSDTGQSPVSTWQAKITETGKSGAGVLLERAGRLSYASVGPGDESIIPLVSGCVEFDFLPSEPATMTYAAFDSGNIRITGHGRGAQLNAILVLTNGEKVKLVAPAGSIKIGQWNRVALRYNLLRSKNPVLLEINGDIAASGTASGTRLSDPSEKIHWGIYGWGGNAWNGIYDNLKIE